MNTKRNVVSLTAAHIAHFHTGSYNREFIIEPQPDGTLRVNSVYCGTHVEAESVPGYGIVLRVKDASTPAA